jgi:hypothetical protein
VELTNSDHLVKEREEDMFWWQAILEGNFRELSFTTSRLLSNTPQLASGFISSQDRVYDYTQSTASPLHPQYLKCKT